MTALIFFTAQTASIAFIRAVINRRVQLPEVYDAADLIASNAIKAHSSVIRTQGIALSMSFLLNYPLSNRRLKQHVNFFITNLSYEHPEGRQSAINAVKGKVQNPDHCDTEQSPSHESFL